VDLHLHSPI